MAMARKPPDLAGKMGGLAVGSNCDLCGATKSIKYCAECNVKLCATCTKGHGVLPTTKDHPLLDLTMLRSGSSYAKSGDAESGPYPCAKHNQELLEFYCEACKLIICRDCRKDHNGHSIKALKDDVKIYQAICTEHIKSLLDKSHDLEGRKLLVDGIFTNYDEAIELVKKWEKELVELVQKCSRLLREDLDKTKKEWENVVNDKEKGLNATMTNVENEISKLYSIRKVSDIDIFSNELVASQRLLEKVEAFMKNVLPTLKVPRVGEILPNMTKLPLLKAGIVDLMTSHKEKINRDSNPKSNADSPKTWKAITLHTHPTPNLISPSRKYQTEIPNPNSYSGYGISKSLVSVENVMLYGSTKKDIRIFNLNDKTLEKFTSECEIWDMVSTGLDEHVAVSSHSLYILNSKFEIVKSRTTGKSCYGISYLSDHKFVLLELDKSDKNDTAFISRIFIKGSEFCIESETKVDTAGPMKNICVGEDKRNIFMWGASHLHKVNMENWSVQHFDMSTVNKKIKLWSLCIIGENLLVGDGSGKVHKLKMNLDYVNVILDVSAPIRGIACVSGYLVLTSEDDKIFLYK